MADGENHVELRFTPAFDQDFRAAVLQRIATSAPRARHVIIADQAGVHPGVADARLPANGRLVPLPPDSPELNAVKKLGDLVTDAIYHQLFTVLRLRGDAILAEANAGVPG